MPSTNGNWRNTAAAPAFATNRLLESALARPQQLHAYGDPPPDLAQLAASLAFGLARNHPFVDGNKRTAAVACETFLLLNGALLDADDLALYPMYLGIGGRQHKRRRIRRMVAAHILSTAKGHSVQDQRPKYTR